MKKLLWAGAGILALAAVAWVQVGNSSPRPLASLMPAGPMIYLETKDFHSLLSEWNQSSVKRSWLASANYRVFSNSNLLQKITGLYQEYSVVAGFLPGLPGTLEIAGRESSLAIYDLREQYFVYVTRVPESQLTGSQLWRLREKFTERQSSGIPFYFRRDDASNRTVAFAFTNGYLVLATRDDLMAHALALIAPQTGSTPEANLSDEPWFRGVTGQAGNPGEIRMALNMQSLVSDVRFRSYWIQRNVSELRAFNAGLTDFQRGQNEITEKRVFVRPAEQSIATPLDSAIRSLAAIRGLAPADAAFLRAWAAPSPGAVRSLIEAKLLQPNPAASPRPQYAPDAAPTDETAGSEQDLEARIDEPAFSDDVAGKLQSESLQDLIAKAAPDALLQVQTSASAGRFVRTPTVLVISTPLRWDAARIRESLAAAVETVWSTSQLGVVWQRAVINRHGAERLNGLATLLFAIEGNLLFLSNDPELLGATLDRLGTAPLTSGPRYIAEFRHGRERADYLRIMQALDFGARTQAFLFNPQGDQTPHFFSENLASLSSSLDLIRTMSIESSDSPEVQRQIVIYR
jgi:hypothetical protein